jgi:hypothetical protein
LLIVEVKIFTEIEIKAIKATATGITPNYNYITAKLQEYSKSTKEQPPILLMLSVV